MTIVINALHFLLCVSLPLAYTAGASSCGTGRRRKAGETGTAFPAPDSCFFFL